MAEYTFHHEPNWDGIRYEAVRKLVDPTWLEWDGRISDAYYNYWSQGLSNPIADLSTPPQTFDKQASVELSKELFLKLSAAAWAARMVAFDAVNQSLPAPYVLSEEETAEITAAIAKRDDPQPGDIVLVLY